MATRNFRQMTTKKLVALMETANDEDKALIQEVLNARNAVAAKTTKNDDAEKEAESPAAETELSEEEKAAIAAAEAESPVAQKEEKPKKAAKAKLTDEERTKLAEKLRAETVDHKCQVVPFNSIEWVNGVIVAIIEEKRTNKVMFAVKTEDGRRVVKAHDSHLIKILEETVERAKRTRGTHKGEAEAEEPWTDEEIEAAVKEVIGNVGKTVSYPEAGAYGQISENAATITGRIVSLVPAKRSKTILYRIELDKVEGDNNTAKKYAHKVSTLDTLEIADDLDEVGKKINEAFTARRYRESAESKPKMNEKEALEYAKAQFEKAEALLEKRKASLEEATKAYEAAIAEGKTFDEPVEEPIEEASEETEGEDLM